MAFAPMWFISPFMVLIQALINIVAASITLNTTTIATCTNQLLPGMSPRFAPVPRLTPPQCTQAVSWCCHTCS